MTTIRKNRILIVNDAATVGMYIQMLLRSAAYETDLAINGVEALRVLNNKTFDLIITDLNMPEMDGYELTRHIRTHDDYRFVPVIFVTAGDQDEIYRKAKEVGSTAFIQFPFSKDRILKIIRSLIR